MSPLSMATLEYQGPKRSTMSTVGGGVQRSSIPHPRVAQCTHLTMTRLYSTEFRCQICLRHDPLGWIYRCDQDRELLLEDDIDRGCEETFDALSDLFPKSQEPMKRSPAARMSKLSFLEEISDTEVKTYTPTQLSQILAQRAHVLDVVSESDNETFKADRFYSTPLVDKSSLLPNPSGSPSKTLKELPPKSWLSLKGGECQFKCCHFCRPTLVDRSWLSVNGIVNGDIPSTVTTGFGFHLQKKRPVALVKHVRNLGLRPNPPPRPQTPESLLLQQERRHLCMQTLRSRHLPLPTSIPRPLPLPPPFLTPTPNLGLGLLLNPTESLHPSQTGEALGNEDIHLSQSHNSLPSLATMLANVSPYSWEEQQGMKQQKAIGNGSAYAPEVQCAFYEMALLQRPQLLLHAPQRTPSVEQAHPSPEIQEEFGLFEGAAGTALPLQTDEELDIISAPLTSMEQDELRGKFAKEPLEVQDGVAVLEESLQLHLPDVITQF